MSTQRIAIVGAGSVGATLAYQLSVQGLVPELWLIDANPAKAEAEALDIAQGTPLGNVVRVQAGGFEGCREAGIAVITAGAKQKPGETRLDLLERNASLLRAITGSILGAGFRGIILVVSNPVDVLTWLVREESGLPASRVIGEHGDTSVPAWSSLSIAGVRLVDFCPSCGARLPDTAGQGGCPALRAGGGCGNHPRQGVHLLRHRPGRFRAAPRDRAR